MHKIIKHLKIAKLLVEEMFGQVNSDRESELIYWKERHQKTYRYVHEWDNYEARKVKLSKLDVSKEWEALERKKNQRKTKPFLINLLKYAAVIVMLLSIGSITYLIYDVPEKIEKEVALAEISHGEKKAELILSNGQSIQLYPLSKNKLKEVDGTVIANDSAMLSYKGVDKNSNEKSNTTLYNTLNIAHGGEYFLVLNDGTRVWLNSLSTLKYPVVFGGRERIVELTGEAYFEVASDVDHPFVVKNRNFDINVLGTSFNISCYNEDDAVATLVEGRVKISNIRGGEHEGYNLSANDQLIYGHSDESILIQKVDAKAYSSWVNGSFSFENETLEKIFQKLERWYDIEVGFKTEKAKSYEFTGRLPRFEDLGIILEMLEIIGEVQFSVEGKTVIIDVE